MSKKRKPGGNPLFEHYSRMASLYRDRTEEHFNTARGSKGRNPEKERTALDNAIITEEKALHYARLAEKEKPVENPN